MSGLIFLVRSISLTSSYLFDIMRIGPGVPQNPLVTHPVAKPTLDKGAAGVSEKAGLSSAVSRMRETSIFEVDGSHPKS